MDWMQTLVIIMAIVIIILLVIMIAIGVSLYRLSKKARGIADHLEFTAANIEKVTGNAAKLAGGGIAAKLASRAFESWVKTKTESNGKKRKSKKSS